MEMEGEVTKAVVLTTVPMSRARCDWSKAR